MGSPMNGLPRSMKPLCRMDRELMEVAHARSQKRRLDVTSREYDHRNARTVIAET